MTQADPGERRAIDARFSPLFQRGHPAAGLKGRTPTDDRVARPVQPVQPVPTAPRTFPDAPTDEAQFSGTAATLASGEAHTGGLPEEWSSSPDSPSPQLTPLASVRIFGVRLSTFLTLLSTLLAAASVGAFFWSWNAQRSTPFFSGDGTLGADTATLFAATQFAAATAPLVFAIALTTAIVALILTASARRNR